jgi:hypothetical protein
MRNKGVPNAKERHIMFYEIRKIAGSDEYGLYRKGRLIERAGDETEAHHAMQRLIEDDRYFAERS